MSVSLTLASLWVIGACIPAMFPSKRHHWPLAYGLITLAIPLLLFIFLQHGLWIALACTLAALSILRWPAIYAVKWVKKTFGFGK